MEENLVSNKKNWNPLKFKEIHLNNILEEELISGFKEVDENYLDLSYALVHDL